MAVERKKYKPEFKLKVALDAIKCKRKISDLAVIYNIHLSQIYQWRQKLLDQGHEIFIPTADRLADQHAPAVKLDRLRYELSWLMEKVVLNEELVPAAKKRPLVDRRNHRINVSRQCQLLGVNRSSVYYKSARGK